MGALFQTRNGARGGARIICSDWQIALSRKRKPLLLEQAALDGSKAVPCQALGHCPVGLEGAGQPRAGRVVPLQEHLPTHGRDGAA